VAVAVDEATGPTNPASPSVANYFALSIRRHRELLACTDLVSLLVARIEAIDLAALPRRPQPRGTGVLTVICL
jgi:hypothetical protein